MSIGSISESLFRRADTTSIFGMAIAEEELLKALLSADIVDRVDLFGPSILASAIEADRQAVTTSIAVRFPRFSQRVHFRPLFDIAPAALSGRYCFIASAMESPRVASLRAALPGLVFPTTTLVHAVNWMDSIPYYLAMAFTAMKSDRIVTSSQAAETATRTIGDWIANLCGRPLPALRRVPFGVDPDLVRAPRELARRLLALPSEANVVLYFGRLSREYKADLTGLIRASGGLVRDGEELLLVIAGSDRDRQAASLSDEARAAGLEDRFRCLPNVSDAGKALLFAAADLFVSPVDNIQESFGLSLLEAMAYELPVVAADWSGYRDIVTDGETGFLVPTYWDPLAADLATLLATIDMSYGVPAYLASRTSLDWAAAGTAIKALLRDKVLRARMGAAGRRRVSDAFSWRSVAHRYGEVLREQRREHGEGVPEVIRPLSFNEVFGRYATDILGSQTHVVCTARGLEHLRESEPQAEGSLASAILRRSQEPIALNEWLQNFQPDRWHALVQLLKNGDLTVVR